MRTQWRLAAAGITCVVMLSSILWAGETEPGQVLDAVSSVTAGSRVRLRAPTVVAGRTEGVVIQIDEDSLLLGGNDRSLVNVPRRAITELEVSAGRRRQTVRGMWIGAAFGAGLAAAWGASGCLPAVGCGESYLSAEGVLASAAFGAAYGAGIGALVKSEHWRGIPLDEVQMTVAPTRGRGVGLSVSIGF